jgi:hypothetical protein
MRTDSQCVDASRIELKKDNELSWLINHEYPESPVSSFLALLTTVVYRNSYNEAFSLPLYLYTSKYSSNNGLGNLAEYFVKQSFTFDSNINSTLPELSRAIASTLASSALEKTPSNYDEIAWIIVCLSEKPLSQEMLDAAEALHNQTNSELTCLVTNTDESVEIAFLNSNSSRYQRIPEYLCNLATAVGKNPHQCIHTFNILSPEEIQQQLRFGRGEQVSLPDRPVYQNIEAFAVETPRQAFSKI